ncbi:hypothetical protein GGQ84_002324 [Desulfitispora alkaliphila]|uniref:hypothetical protein n=1 Tax=Desulfitispora alkaliphila TaxID=622674 RepID=UPI003D1AD120
MDSFEEVRRKALELPGERYIAVVKPEDIVVLKAVKEAKELGLPYINRERCQH